MQPSRAALVVGFVLILLIAVLVAVILPALGDGDAQPALKRGALLPPGAAAGRSSDEPPLPRRLVEAAGDPEPTPGAGREKIQTEANPARGVLRGRVFQPGGKTPAPGVTALLLPGTKEPPPERVEQITGLGARPDTLRVTDDEGRFTFTGLQPGQPYSLLLGGNGLVGSQRYWPVQAKEGESLFSMHHLFGALIHVRDSNGGPPRVNAGLIGQRAGRALSTVAGVFPMFGSPSSALLAGVPLERIRPASLDERLMLFTSSTLQEEVGPFQFRASFPGYEPIQLEFKARQAQLGFSEYEVEAIPTADGFGEIEISLIGWRGPGKPFDTTSSAAFLRLNSTTGEVLHFEVRDLDEQRITIAGIPFGSYDASFGTNPHLRSTVRGGPSSQEVVVGVSPGRMQLDLSQRASLELRLTDAEGQPVTGRVALLVSKDGTSSRGWRTHHFIAPPYRIDDLEPGTWNLVLQQPFKGGTEAARPLPVPLSGGACRVIELHDD